MKRSSPTPARQPASLPQPHLEIAAEAQVALARLAAADADAGEIQAQAERARQVFDNMLYAARLAHERAGIGRYQRPRYADEAGRAAERSES